MYDLYDLCGLYDLCDLYDIYAIYMLSIVIFPRCAMVDFRRSSFQNVSTSSRSSQTDVLNLTKGGEDDMVGKKNTLLALTRILPVYCCKDYSVLITSTMSAKHRRSSTRVNPVGTCLYPHYNCPH